MKGLEIMRNHAMQLPAEIETSAAAKSAAAKSAAAKSAAAKSAAAKSALNADTIRQYADQALNILTTAHQRIATLSHDATPGPQMVPTPFGTYINRDSLEDYMTACMMISDLKRASVKGGLGTLAGYYLAQLMRAGDDERAATFAAGYQALEGSDGEITVPAFRRDTFLAKAWKRACQLRGIKSKIAVVRAVTL